MERVQGNILMVLDEDAGCKAWDEPRDRHYPCPGKSPAEVCPGNDTNEGVLPHTSLFLSISPHPFDPVDVAALGHFSYYSLWGKNREGRCSPTVNNINFKDN